MWLTDEDQEEVRSLLRQSTMKNRKLYTQMELAFYHKMKAKYGEKIATQILAKMWRTKVEGDDDETVR